MRIEDILGWVSGGLVFLIVGLTVVAYIGLRFRRNPDLPSDVVLIRVTHEEKYDLQGNPRTIMQFFSIWFWFLCGRIRARARRDKYDAVEIRYADYTLERILMWSMIVVVVVVAICGTYFVWDVQIMP